MPVDNFYEWKKTSNGKIPMRFTLKSGEPFAFAGLWETWKNPEDEWVRTFTIITGEPNDLVKPVHDRMPVMLLPENEKFWLDDEAGETVWRNLLRPYPADLMTASYPAMPHDPVMTRFLWETPRKGYEVGRFIAEIGGRPVAFLAWIHAPWNKLPVRHCEVEVWLDRSRLELDRLTSMWSWIGDAATDQGSQLLLAYCGEDEPEMLEALGSLGYQPERGEKVWELDLTKHAGRLREDAAAARKKMDGAGILRTFFSIVLPLAAPGVFTAAILAFINAWNEFLFGVSFTTNDTVRPVTVGLVNFFGGASYIIPWGEIAAGAIIVTVPLIIVVLILQRRIVAGLTAGAVKG